MTLLWYRQRAEMIADAAAASGVVPQQPNGCSASPRWRTSTRRDYSGYKFGAAERQALQTHLDQATQLLADYTGESFRKSR